MPAVVPFIPLIVGGVQAGVSLANSHAQGSAQERSTAAQLEAQRQALLSQEKTSTAALGAERDAADKAIQFQTEQRDYDRRAAAAAREDYLKRQSPYIQMGNAAYGRLGDLLKVPSQGAPTGQPSGQMPPAGGQAPSQAPPPSGGSFSMLAQPQAATGPQVPSQGGVRMVAPTGEVGTVPYDQVGAAIAKGARRLSA